MTVGRGLLAAHRSYTLAWVLGPWDQPGRCTSHLVILGSPNGLSSSLSSHQDWLVLGRPHPEPLWTSSLGEPCLACPPTPAF